MIRFSSFLMAYLNKSLFQDLKKTKPYTQILFLSAARGEIQKTKMSQFPFSNNAVSQTTTKCSEDNIVWVDMEMTGLDPDQDHVLEVACLVSDSQLNILAEGPDLAIYQPPEVLENMNEWSLKQHAVSGLTRNCEASKVTLRDAELQLLDFVRTWTPFKKCPLGGNTIYMDRMFLKKHMPDFEQHMHYRIIDVSSVKELCRRWYPALYCKQPNKKELSEHRALSDIKASIAELHFYREKVFCKTDESSGMSRC